MSRSFENLDFSLGDGHALHDVLDVINRDYLRKFVEPLKS